MDHHRGSSPIDREAVLCILKAQHGSSLDAAACAALTEAILPYVARSRQPLADAVTKIAINYLADGELVRQLVASSRAPEQTREWDLVLTQIIDFAKKQTKYPKDTEAVSAPDLDAYDDVRRNIASYNFEGPFEHWLTATVISRLQRYWRDRQTKRAGGHGIRRSAAHQADAQAAERRAAPNAYHVPLDRLLASDAAQRTIVAPLSRDVSELVASRELEQIVVQELRRFASDRNDPLLLPVWDAIVVRGMKLRETAAQLDLTISQVYRRIEQARLHLQRSPRVNQWCDF